LRPLSQIPVLYDPGSIKLTYTPNGSSSNRSDSLNPRSAYLEPAYGVKTGNAKEPLKLPVLMIFPLGCLSVQDDHLEKLIVSSYRSRTGKMVGAILNIVKYR